MWQSLVLPVCGSQSVVCRLGLRQCARHTIYTADTRYTATLYILPQFIIATVQIGAMCSDCGSVYHTATIEEHWRAVNE